MAARRASSPRCLLRLTAKQRFRMPLEIVGQHADRARCVPQLGQGAQQILLERGSLPNRAIVDLSWSAAELRLAKSGPVWIWASRVNRSILASVRSSSRNECLTSGDAITPSAWVT